MTENTTEIAYRPGDKALVLFSDRVRRLATLSTGFVWTAEDGQATAVGAAAPVVAAEGGFDAWPFNHGTLAELGKEADEWFDSEFDNVERVSHDPDALDHWIEDAENALDLARLQLHIVRTIAETYFGNDHDSDETLCDFHKGEEN